MGQEASEKASLSRDLNEAGSVGVWEKHAAAKENREWKGSKSVLGSRTGVPQDSPILVNQTPAKSAASSFPASRMVPSSSPTLPGAPVPFLLDPPDIPKARLSALQARMILDWGIGGTGEPCSRCEGAPAGQRVLPPEREKIIINCRVGERLSPEECASHADI